MGRVSKLFICIYILFQIHSKFIAFLTLFVKAITNLFQNYLHYNYISIIFKNNIQKGVKNGQRFKKFCKTMYMGILVSFYHWFNFLLEVSHGRIFNG